MKIAEVALDIPVRKTFSYLVPDDFAIVPGRRVLVSFGKARMRGWIIGEGSPVQGQKYKNIIKAYDEGSLVPGRVISIAQWISDMHLTSTGRVLGTISGDLSLKKTEEAVSQVAVSRQETITFREGPFDTVAKDIENGSLRILVEFGSDRKQDFFVDAARYASGSALFIFARLKDAARVYKRIANEFPGRVVLFTGDMNRTEKTANWIRMLQEEKLIVVGTRLALFAPVSDLSLVVIDEPEDFAHKEKKSPRYHAREVAAHISENENVPLVLTTFQPDLAEIKMVQDGALVLRKIAECALPAVIVTKLERGWEKQVLSSVSRHLVERTILEGKRVVLIHNRKEYAKLVICRECGWLFTCERCGNLVVPVSERQAKCKLDDVIFQIPTACPSCGKKKIKVAKPGLGKIKATIESAYQDVPVITYTAGPFPVFEKAGIIIGTQALEGVLDEIQPALVVFLNADFLAARSSFQSEERFFILVQRIRKKIFQSGTAIILQTHNPALQVYRFLASGNPEEYYQHELEIRKGLGFPPFGTIIRISTSGKNAESCMSRVIESLQNYGDIYEEDKTEKRMLSILWKVPDKQRAIYMLSELLQTQKIRNISIDIDSQF